MPEAFNETEARTKLATLHDDLVWKYSQTNDPQQESVLLEEIGLVEYLLFYGEPTPCYT